MKKFTTLYYFLFLLLITGAFASMDQHSYGLVLSGLACLGFATMFIYENISGSDLTQATSKIWVGRIELVILSGIALLFMLRNFLIDFYFSNQVMSVLLITMLFINLYYLVSQVRSTSFVLALSLYYTSITALIFSLLAAAHMPSLEKSFAIAGVVLVVLFLIVAGRTKRAVVNDEPITIWKYMRGVSNKSSIVLTAGVLLAVFYLLVSTRSLPPLYRANMPEGYQHLVDNISTERDAREAREYKDRFDTFIKKPKP